MQFIPKDGLYIYFRYDPKQTIMVITNTGEKPVKPDWNHYIEMIKGFTHGKEVVSGNRVALGGFEIKPKESFVLELEK